VAVFRVCAGLFVHGVFALPQAIADPIQGSGSTIIDPLIHGESIEYQTFLSGGDDFTTGHSCESREMRFCKPGRPYFLMTVARTVNIQAILPLS
jgi:hypothetical protein